jgi:N-acetylglucosaminyldiphosphoundecaprenol N-acetyl-beta-D-mannosaminyltransferase
MNAETFAPFVTIMNSRIDNLAMDEVLGRIEKLAAGPASSHVITANVDHLMVNRQNSANLEIYRRAALVVPDGVPLLWAARFLGTPLRERINGTDLMEKTCELAARKNFSIFLLGAPAGEAQDAAVKLQRALPGLSIAGTYAPYFGFEDDSRENEKICSLLRKNKPDILFVSLGVPKGLTWIDRYQRACGIALAMEVGASFAFISGRLKRAPLWMQKNGLEWLWRLILEPRRLWKRYLLNDLPFFFHLFSQKYRGNRPGKH